LVQVVQGNSTNQAAAHCQKAGYQSALPSFHPRQTRTLSSVYRSRHATNKSRAARSFWLSSLILQCSSARQGGQECSAPRRVWFVWHALSLPGVLWDSRGQGLPVRELHCFLERGCTAFGWRAGSLLIPARSEDDCRAERMHKTNQTLTIPRSRLVACE